MASKWGKDNIVKLLLEKGAQIDVKTKDGLSECPAVLERPVNHVFSAPLHCAARSGHDQVVDLLLESGAPFGAKTKNGLSALHMGEWSSLFRAFELSLSLALSAAQGDHVDAARILLYYKSTLVDDVSSVSESVCSRDTGDPFSLGLSLCTARRFSLWQLQCR